MAHPHWPLFDLEIRTPRLTMRYVDDELATRLATLAAHGIHDPDWMPFAMPWSSKPSPELERQALQFHWRCRVETAVDKWTINFAVIVDGEVVGTSGLMTDGEFSKLRQFETGSWLGREHQGKGIGTEMRVATLQLGFIGFGAEWAVTGAWHDNAASLGVTRKLGYTEQGRRRLVRNDERGDDLIGFEMPRRHFVERLRRDDIELVGVDAVRDQLGITR